MASNLKSLTIPFSWLLKLKRPSLAQVEREALLLVVLGAGIFYYLAVASFNPLDPSSFSAAFPPQITNNLAGTFGAELAANSIYLFGLIALFLPIPILVSTFLLAMRVPAAFGAGRIIGWASLLYSGAGLLQLAHPAWNVGGFSFHATGISGEKLFANLPYRLGHAGYITVMVTLLLFGLVLVTRLTFIEHLAQHLQAKRASFDSWFGLFSFKNLFGKGEKKAEAAPAVEPSPLLAVAQPEPTTSAPAPLFAEEPAPVQNELQQAINNDLTFKAIENEVDAQTVLQPQNDEVYKVRPKSNYERPPVTLFRSQPQSGRITDEKKREFETTAENIVKAFGDFGVTGKVVAIQPGPVVTVYEFQANAGTKLAKIVGLTDDIALALKVDSIFIHPVSGKQAVGIQVPNQDRELVYLGDVLQAEAFQKAESPLTFVMGKSLKGEPVCADLAAMPHLLMAGQTGSGKSVAINALLCSLILKASPDELKLILVDPKILELKTYEGIPHLLMPVITEPSRASLALKWATEEMERRYKLMECAKVRHISGFNSFLEKATAQDLQQLHLATGEDEISSLPYIVVVIDELADLMLTAPKDVEGSIQRLAQKARASGIHLVLATQRPSVDVITGVIKANLPCRVSFKVFSRVDSRTILDSIGSEKLLGRGDMMFLKPGIARLIRLQGAFLEDQEVVTLVNWLKEKATADYNRKAMQWIDDAARKDSDEDMAFAGEGDVDDPKWQESLHIAQHQGAISASYLQRQLKIGYNRAARMVEAMEKMGYVAKADGSKPRKWLGGTKGGHPSAES
jgi:S-DNA-T family DNA segregation ATPase FtsK/SpoIIIE